MRLFIAGNDARGEHDGIALLDLACLWLSTAARESADMGSPCVPLIITQTFSGGKFFDLAGMDQQAVGHVKIAEVLRDLGRIVHRAADKRDLAPVLLRQLDSQLDAMDRRRETGDEQPPLGARKDLVELAADGPLAGRVSMALYVGRILQQREHAFFAVLGEGVQIEEAGCRSEWDRL